MKCDRCGVEIVGDSMQARDKGVAHKHVEECIAYNLSKIWLVLSMGLNSLRSIEQDLDRLADSVEIEEEELT
jgi:hypothetical protein